MSQCKNGRPTILVTDAGWGSAIAIIRSLGRKGWRVIAADSDPNNLGFRSRFVRGRLTYPSPETEPEACVAALERAARERRIDLIIPVTDAIILPLSASRERFEGTCKLALPEAGSLAVASNKLRTMELADRLGVPVPRTRLAHTVDEARQRACGLGWPVVLKPQFSRVFRLPPPGPPADGGEARLSTHHLPLTREVSRVYRGQSGSEAFRVCYAENTERLAEQMKQFEGRCPVLMQEFTRGIGYGVELLMDRGRPLAAFQHKRLREIPISGGASAFRESVPLDPELYRHAVRLLQSLCWTGLAMVEFKVGSDGAKLMEINGRVWGSLPLATHSGMDFPARLAELFLYGPPNGRAGGRQGYAVGVRARNLELELMWIASVLLRRQRYPFLAIPSWRQGLAALLGLLNPAYKFDILSLEDLCPGLAEVPKIIRKLHGKLKAAALST